MNRGTTNISILALIVACGIVGVVFFFYSQRPCANFHEAILQTPTHEITVALADTPEQQSKGLGGCAYIPKNAGMYFTFTDMSERTFWMKDMSIPIDIVWIADGRVVGIEKHVPNLPPSTPDDALPRYTSPEAVDAVLEVNAGMAEMYGIDENTVIRDTSLYL